MNNHSTNTLEMDPMTHQFSIIRLFHCLAFGCLVGVITIPAWHLTTYAQEPPIEDHVTVTLQDFHVRPDKTQAQAGRVSFTAVNEGISLHELVILRTDLDPAELPRKEAKDYEGTGREYLVNEDDAEIVTIDEIEEFPAGTSQKKIVSLNPGHYVLFCNIPGHYDKGMYASLHIVLQ